MKSIEKINENFQVKQKQGRENTVVYNVLSEPFSIFGLIKPEGENALYRRMPEDVAASVSENVYNLSSHTAGGRVRFRTNSSYMAIAAKLGTVGRMPHFALTGSAGFDLFCAERHIATFKPQYYMEHELFGETDLSGEMADYTVNFPLYSVVYELYVILDDGALLEPPTPYEYENPIVFYGSSITQGGCASRPGNAYTAVLSRRLNADHINLGFSGNAKGEAQMAEYIADLKMSAFVFDYDHNAPNAAHLEQTHKQFFDIVRAKNPDLPIICMTRPINDTADFEQRRQIITDTARSDQNTYFVDIKKCIEEYGVLNEASVDNTHPNDLGFYFMANAVEPILKNVLKKNKF